tara:strand:- start:280 stop:516 length:237 start_codon:yes stop_codon:yes gene_type:complete
MQLKPEAVNSIEIVLARYGNSLDLGKAADREKVATEIWANLIKLLNKSSTYNYVNKGDDIEYNFVSPHDPGDEHQEEE